MTEEEIRDLCEQYCIGDYTIVEHDRSVTIGPHEDLIVHVPDGACGRLPFKFNNCPGYMDCSNNRLTTLEGCPETIYGHFDCSHNELTSLKYGPVKTVRGFCCSYNRLTTLVGGPKEVGAEFDCSTNDLTSLVGCPQILESDREVSMLRCHGNQIPFEEIFRWYVNSGFNGKILSDHGWLNVFLNNAPRDHIWQKQFSLFKRKYGNG